MTAANLKASIHNLVDQINDEELLEAYLKIIEVGISSHEIIGFSTTGNPLTRQSLIDEVKMASQRVKAGRYISQEELEEKASDW